MNRVFIVAVPDEINFQTKLFGDEIIISGVGKINAAMAACRAINKGYKEVINIGSCGSLSLPSGTIVKVGRVFQDIDVTPLIDYGKTPFEDDLSEIILDPNEIISCFTTDYFYDASQKSKYSKKYLKMLEKHTIFDMEVYAIAKVCYKYHVKFTSYKWVSDNGDGHNWKENCKVNFEKLKNII